MHNKKSEVTGNCVRPVQPRPREITGFPADIRVPRGTTSGLSALEFQVERDRVR